MSNDTFDQLKLDQTTAGEIVDNYLLLSRPRPEGEAAPSNAVLQTRLEQLSIQWENFNKRHFQISRMSADHADDEYFTEGVYFATERHYIEAKAEMQHAIQMNSLEGGEVNQAPGNNVTLRQVPTQPTLNFQKLTPPRFDGDPMNWETFKERFTSMVKDVPSIPKVHKLQHLLASLDGEAANAFKNTKIIAANFDLVWQQLLNRYDRTRARLETHFFHMITAPTADRTAADITHLIDSMQESIRALTDMRRPTEYWDDWFVYLTTSKLDKTTREDWEKSIEANDDFPTFDDLVFFLERRAHSLRAVQGSSTSASKNISIKKSVSVHTMPKQNQNKKTQPVCSLCTQSHTLSSCQKFSNLTLAQRKSHVFNKKLCSNCLKLGHFADKCQSPFRCRTCQGTHHTKLHQEQQTPADPASKSSSSQASQPPTSTATNVLATNITSTVLLATAVVIMQSPKGHSLSVRALIDPAAEASFITQHVHQSLQLDGNTVNVSVAGIGGSITQVAKLQVDIVLQSRVHTKFSLPFSALVLSHLTSSLPSSDVSSKTWPHLKKLKLADPHFATPGRIDAILSADIYSSITQHGLRRGPRNAPIAQNSSLGWLVLGPTGKPSTGHSTAVFHTSIDENLAHALQRFWEIEEVPKTAIPSHADVECEKHFTATVSQRPDGRLILKLPFCRQPEFLQSRNIAEACFHRLERRFAREPQFAAAYQNFMQVYLDLGQMKPIPAEDIHQPSYYIPHHAVYKNEKIRVVFNASQKAKNGISLNDCLFAGPKVQVDLPIILLRWRFFKCVFIADIVKMYRQFLVDVDDANYQRILWRFHPDEPIIEYRLLTLTYGTASAQYLAIKALLYLAENHSFSHVLAATTLKDLRYVDDIFAGANDEATLQDTKHQLIEVLKSAQLELGKWSSNTPACLQQPNDLENPIPINLEECTSTLGLNWNPVSDSFVVKVSVPVQPVAVTKRTISSVIAKLYDPLGFLSPVTIRAKLMLQSLWIQGLDWDVPADATILENWQCIQHDLQSLNDIEIPRWFQHISPNEWEIHGFCDASERAYVASIYIVSTAPSGQRQAHLMMSKTKVAPIKTISVDKLELFAAVLLANLVNYLTKHLQHQPSRIHCWGDNKIVLAWLQGHPSRWQPLIAHRVAKVMELLPDVRWRYVPTTSNPADFATRGKTTQELRKSTLWWHGPSWILETEDDWPEQKTIPPTQVALRKTATVLVNTLEQEQTFECRISKFSSFQTIVAITARFLRWRYPRPNDLRLSAEDWIRGRHAVLHAVQKSHFADDIKRLTKNEPLPANSHLKGLNPFLDDRGILRVGGRLENAPLGFNEKHPIILPTNAHITLLIIREAHLATFHGGLQLTTSTILRLYWIVRGRSLIKRSLKNCVRCTRFSNTSPHQQMGVLPSVRVTPTPVFYYTGVDYAGPVYIRTTKGRGHKATKGYIALFVCMVTKAIHIEIVSDYTSTTFLAALRRFIARRSKPKVIFCDNGTTFKGAQSELRRLFDKTSVLAVEISNVLAKEEIEWTFIPPKAPHFGGLWESNIKSMKRHLIRTIGDQKLTFEEFSTVTCQVESILNSRPCSALSDQPEDFTALTPGHFLTGRPLTALPEPTEDVTASVTPSHRWRLVNQIRNHFWKRWVKEVLPALQRRA